MTLRRADINTYLPTELLRAIFLYGIEVNQVKSGQLASVCRHWRSIITSIASLWSTLRIGTWTETERVTLWMQRAYPKKVVIDPHKDSQTPSEAPIFSALQSALTSTSQWHELTISSFPPENLASQLGVQGAAPMSVLKLLHVAAGCVQSSSFTHLLNLVPTGAPLSELRLYPSFAGTHFLQPPWFPVLQNLTVLIISGRNVDEPFGLLPAFTQLQIFEADRLRLPFYEPNTNLPLLSTLRKLQLRACSVQWMAGRQFPCLEECAIVLPHHSGAIQQLEVELPACGKLTYNGYPMTTVQYFSVPKMSAMELGTHDCKEQRVYWQLRHIFTVGGRITILTTLHLTLQCSERAIINVLKYLGLLQEFTISIASPASSWQSFLHSLAVKPAKNDYPYWRQLVNNHREWEEWCQSQTWQAKILPHLKYLGIRCLKGFSQSQRLDNCPLLRLVGWTRAYLTPPLEHLEVWEEKGTADNIVVDYISADCLDTHLGKSSTEYDSLIVRGMVMQRLVIHRAATRLYQLHSSVLFRQLQELDISCDSSHEILVFPYLEQIKKLAICGGLTSVYPSYINLPLVHTLQWLKLGDSAPLWMLGRTFRSLKEFHFDGIRDTFQNQSKHEALQIHLPACTLLNIRSFPVNSLYFLSCTDVQVLRLDHPLMWRLIDETAPKSIRDFLYNRSRLQKLEINLTWSWGVNSLIQFVFCAAWEQGVWRGIRSVEVKVWLNGFPSNDGNYFFRQMVRRQQHYEKWWKECTVSMEGSMLVIVKATM